MALSVPFEAAIEVLIKKRRRSANRWTLINTADPEPHSLTRPDDRILCAGHPCGPLGLFSLATFMSEVIVMSFWYSPNGGNSLLGPRPPLPVLVNSKMASLLADCRNVRLGHSWLSGIKNGSPASCCPSNQNVAWEIKASRINTELNISWMPSPSPSQ